MKRIILDTDPGIDDAVALILALKSKELKLEAVTTVSGNVHVDKCTKNALRILELMRREDVPVAKGASKPLKRRLYTAEHVHGKDGLGDANLPEPAIKAADEHAVDLIIEKIACNPRGVILVPIGPLTNIALAMVKEPEIVENVEGIVLMGGAYGVTPYGFGNVTPVAEFNIYTDPEAARIVFDSGMEMTAVGLDVTTDPQALLIRNDFERIKEANTTAAEIVVKIIEKTLNLRRAVALHDAMAVSYLIYPDLFTAKKYRVDIETKGEFTTGQTVTDRRMGILEGNSEIKKPNVYVCTSVKGREFINSLINQISA